MKKQSQNFEQFVLGVDRQINQRLSNRPDNLGLQILSTKDKYKLPVPRLFHIEFLFYFSQLVDDFYTHTYLFWDALHI